MSAINGLVRLAAALVTAVRPHTASIDGSGGDRRAGRSPDGGYDWAGFLPRNTQIADLGVRRRMPALPGTLVAVATVAASFLAVPAAASSPPELTPTDLRVDYLQPSVTGDRTPLLSWQLASADHDASQQAYQVQAATSRGSLDEGHADLWDSGRVATAATNVTYAGDPLASRQDVYWRVRSWDAHNHASTWTMAKFEMGLLDPSDWQARWITERGWASHEAPQPVAVHLPAQDTRFLRLDVTKLGLPLKEPGFPDPVWRLQLAEIAVEDTASPGVNLAIGAPVSTSESYTVPGAWEPEFLTDGQLTGAHGAYGYTSYERHAPDLTSDIWVQLDLGAVRHLNEVLLYPRTDLQTADGQVPNFPVDYTVQTADDAAGPFTVAASVTGQQPPPPPGPIPPALPILAKQFAVTGEVAKAHLYITGLGMVDTTLNGHPVSSAVLEPPNTDYTKRVTYASYDVTGQLHQGPNTVGAMLGNGLYNVASTPGRYEKLTRSDGPPKLLAQLEITYRDGRRAVIASDESWRATLGPVTFSNWYGGEDVDARRTPQGWESPDADLAGWDAAVVTQPPGPHTVLSAESVPPVQVVATVRPVAITEPKTGVWVADFGHQLAGWEHLQLSGPAGTTVTIRPAERLADDGTALQDGGTGAPFWDSYTLAGGGTETWHPQFVYHGFRYLQLEGLPAPPTASTVGALVLRADNQPAGSFDSSDGLLNGVHQMIAQAVSSNTLLFGSDPNREKLGWLADYAFEFPSINRDYDAAAYFRLLVQDMADAQTADGLVPDIAPEYTVFGGGFRDDPNWGSAIVTVPWNLYQTYGDTATIRSFYPAMQRYFTYLTSRATGNILNYGLGDWGTLDRSVPSGFTATWAYYRDATLLARIADVIGNHNDATQYQAAAAQIADAFNTRFFDAEAATYTGGSQSVDAMALDMGLVPPDQRHRVLDHLLATLQANQYHLTTGMIALPSLFRVLSDTGRDDVVYAIATALDDPSYGWLLVHGETSMTEFWQGADNPGGSEHNMFILGALEEWFTRGIGGIRSDDNGGLADNHLTIRPAVVGAVRQADSTLHTVHGDVATRWRRSPGALSLTVTVPAGVAATVWVPLLGSSHVDAPVGARRLDTEDGAARYEVGSGTWTFTVPGVDAPPPDHPVTWIGGPRSLEVAGGLPTAARFQVVNLAAVPVTLQPSVTVPAGYHVTGLPHVIQLAPLASTEIPLSVTSDAAAPGTLTLFAGDTRADVALGTTDNLARVATMSASSTHSGFPVTTLNDGDASTASWCAGQAGHGWNDATLNVFPDDVTATFPATVTIERVVIDTLSLTTCPYGGVRDVDIQANVGGTWQTIAAVRGNTTERIVASFPQIATTALRLHILDSATHDYSRLVEVEAYAS